MYKVLEQEEITKFLLSKDLKNKKIKSMLKYESVLVNGVVVTKYNFLLRKGDVVTFKNSRTSFKDTETNLKIIYEDKDIIVVDKKAGLLTVSTDKEKTRTLFYQVSEYVKKKNYKNKIFIINRLDKGTSGVVMFAKTEKVKSLYQNKWNELVITRKYTAIVEGILTNKRQTITKPLEEDEKGKVFVSKEGKDAITSFVVLKEKDNLSLLDVDIKTGRKNQIRVHLKSIGHPIIGDAKYGKEASVIKRMGLHCNLLEVKNPITKEVKKFESKVPKEFKLLFKGGSNE